MRINKALLALALGFAIAAAPPPPAEQASGDENGMVVEMLIAAGFVSAAKADEAREIARSCSAQPFSVSVELMPLSAIIRQIRTRAEQANAEPGRSVPASYLSQIAAELSALAGQQPEKGEG